MLTIRQKKNYLKNIASQEDVEIARYYLINVHVNIKHSEFLETNDYFRELSTFNETREYE
jgi:hypothetical protein